MPGNDEKNLKIKNYKQYLYPSLVPGVAYIFVIIDYFQIFNFFKYVESTLKTKFGKKNDVVSCVSPEIYSKRFINYFKELTKIKDVLKESQKEKNDVKNEKEEKEKENKIDGENNDENNNELDLIKVNK